MWLRLLSTGHASEPLRGQQGGRAAAHAKLALEWAHAGVRVNAIAPTYLNAPSTRELLQPGTQFHDWVLARIPQGRALECDEVVGAVVYPIDDMRGELANTLNSVLGRTGVREQHK